MNELTIAPPIADLKVINGAIRMSSKEIAELCGKEHRNVARDVRKLISDKVIDQLNFEQISLPDSYGRMQPAFLLDFDATFTLVLGYDAHRRMAVVKRWRELEEEASKPATPQLPDFTNPAEAARAWADEVEAKVKLEEKIQEDAPKVAYANLVEQSEESVSIGEYVKSISDDCQINTYKQINTLLWS